MILHPYKTTSKSARALAEALGCKILLAAGKVLNNKVFINWGRSEPSERVGLGCEFINHPKCVAVASDKLASFNAFKAEGVTHVSWTTDIKEAKKWQEKGNIVLARGLLKSHSGNGISIVRTNDALPNVPLYSLYVKKNEEYRVHVFMGEVIDVQQKKRQNGAEPNLIRSYKNGYIFCREGVVLSDEAKDLARAAVKALGLHFGAVDLIKGKDGIHYVLEVNTAPGLEGKTVENYATAIKNHF